MSKSQIPFNFDNTTLTKVVNVIRDVYVESISLAASKLNNKIEPLVTKETAKFTVNTEELEMYKLTKKILDRLEDVIKPEDTHKMPKIKRIINWLIRGDFYNEWQAPTECIGDLGKFIPFIQKIFCDVTKGTENYDISVEFTDAARLNVSGNTRGAGYRAEGNLVPLFKFGRKAVPGWNIVLPGERKNDVPVKPPTFVSKQAKSLKPQKLPTVEELITHTSTKETAIKTVKSVWVEKASKPAPETPQTSSDAVKEDTVVCFTAPKLDKSVEAESSLAVTANEPLSPTKEVAKLLDFKTPMDVVDGATLIEAGKSTVSCESQIFTPISISESSALAPTKASMDAAYWHKVSGIASILSRQMYIRGIPANNSTIMEIAASVAGEAMVYFDK